MQPGRKILIVGADTPTRENLRDIVSSLGKYPVETADSAFNGAQKITQHNFRLFFPIMCWMNKKMDWDCCFAPAKSIPPPARC